MTAQAPSASETLRALIIEDDPADLELAVSELHRSGFAVHADVVQDSAGLARALQEGTYDVALADYRLPGWTGIEAFRQLRAAGFDTPLILVTGTLGEERAVECLLEGVADYILKQNLGRLPLAVRRAVSEVRARHEAVRTQQALEESVARFQRLTDASFDAILVTQDGVIREVNRHFPRLFGYDREEDVIGMNPAQLVEDESYAEIERRVKGNVEGTYEIVGKRRDGRTILLEVTMRSTTLDGKPARITALRDISERRALENQLRHAQKMDAVGRLAGGIAHDFNNLLMVISGYADIVVRGLVAGDPRRRDLEQVLEAADAAASLTRQLLAFSGQQVIQPKTIALEEVVQNADQMLRRLIGEDVSLATTLAGQPSMVFIDPGQLEQVIVNLVVNARDAMPTGGQITIETSTVEFDEATARAHGSAAPGHFALLVVSDTGMGMDAATRDRVFDPFFTTKELGTGTGLGLATVYGIVKQGGGSISVTSEPGQGTAFNVYLPVATAAAPAVVAPERPVQLRGAETILLVEDSEGVRDLAQRILREHGYQVHAAAAPTAALQIAENLKGKIDLLLTDVVMPEMSGSVLAERFSALNPDARVLFMSGYTDDAVVRHGVLQADTPYLQKPFSAQILASKVRRLLDGSR